MRQPASGHGPCAPSAGEAMRNPVHGVAPAAAFRSWRRTTGRSTMPFSRTADPTAIGWPSGRAPARPDVHRVVGSSTRVTGRPITVNARDRLIESGLADPIQLVAARTGCAGQRISGFLPSVILTSHTSEGAPIGSLTAPLEQQPCRRASPTESRTVAAEVRRGVESTPCFIPSARVKGTK